MPFIDFPQTLLSELVVNEVDPSVGYARRVIRVAGTGTLPMGAVVYRAKGTDPSATYAPLTAAAQLVATNEFAVVFGDNFGCKFTIPLQATPATTGNAVAFVRGMIILKEYLLRQYTNSFGTPLTDTQFASLKHLLEQQNIRVEITLTEIV